VKDNFRLELDPELTKIYWIFKGHESITYIPTPRKHLPEIRRLHGVMPVDYRALVKKVKHLVREISSLS